MRGHALDDDIRHSESAQADSVEDDTMTNNTNDGSNDGCIIEDGEEHAPEAPSPPPTTEPSLPGDYLPVASPVPPRVRRANQASQQQENIQHATPYDPEQEHNRHRRHQLWLVLAILLAIMTLVGTILGVTFLRPKSNNNDNATSFEPTPSPTFRAFGELQQLLEYVSFDRGAALQDPDSPQSKALTWLAGDTNFKNYPDWRRMQRYALAVFYYSTNGDEWRDNGGWLSEADECTWLTHETNAPVCNPNGAYIDITLKKNNLRGTIPLELALLSDSLCKSSLS